MRESVYIFQSRVPSTLPLFFFFIYIDIYIFYCSEYPPRGLVAMYLPFFFHILYFSRRSVDLHETSDAIYHEALPMPLHLGSPAARQDETNTGRYIPASVKWVRGQSARSYRNIKLYSVLSSRQLCTHINIHAHPQEYCALHKRTRGSAAFELLSTRFILRSNFEKCISYRV